MNEVVHVDPLYVLTHAAARTEYTRRNETGHALNRVGRSESLRHKPRARTYRKNQRIRTGECTSIFGFGSYPPKFSYEIPSKFHQRFPPIFMYVPQNSLHSSPSIIRYQNHLTSIKISDDSDFGFGSSSPFSDDDEPSTTTAEALIDDGSKGEQQQRRQQGDEGKNEENEKLKKTKDVPSLDGEQGKEDSTTTAEALIDDGSEGEQQQQRQQGDEGKNKENEKLKKTNDVPSLDGEQGKEDSTTTTEAVIDDGSK